MVDDILTANDTVRRAREFLAMVEGRERCADTTALSDFLEAMATGITRVLEDHGVLEDNETLNERIESDYRERAEGFTDAELDNAVSRPRATYGMV